MFATRFVAAAVAAMAVCPAPALAVSSAELYTAAGHSYGRFESRMRYATGDGVVSSFFLWKDGSEVSGTFWNELDFEKVAAECRLETNPIFGRPPSNSSQRHALGLDLCGSFHTYAFEWTPDAIAWLVDGLEIRRETGATAEAYAANAGERGMQLRFNLWPGDASFGGNFDPVILPVHEYIDWVQYSKWQDGAFELVWREDFDGGALPSGWLTGSWPSPKNKSTHAPENVNFVDGFAVLSLTADDAKGPPGTSPTAGGGGSGGSPPTSGGSSATAGSPAVAGATAAPNASSGGCSMAPHRTTSASAAGWGLLVIAGWLGRRRRRHV